MSDFGESPLVYRDFQKTSLQAMAGNPSRKEVTHHVKHIASLPSVRIPVPDLMFARVFLERWEVCEEPGGVSWKESHYNSFSPSLFSIDDAVVHSDAGLVSYEDLVIADTFEHADSERYRFVDFGAGVSLAVSSPKKLAGMHFSALSGAGSNYFHLMVDSIAKLSLLPDSLSKAVSSILVPGHSFALFQEILRNVNLHFPLTAIGPTESLRVERLLLPSSIHGQTSYHPCLLDVFRSSRQPAPPPVHHASNGKFYYIDRRKSLARRLTNEAELVDSLIRLKFCPLFLEELTVGEQIAVFRDAELIVAPHGAGLTNLVYAKPSCKIIELVMDAYCHWGFRRLAALNGIGYDCILGRCIGPWMTRSPAAHMMKWEISVHHVQAAIETLRDR